MSSFNPSNAGYLPMVNHGEFSSVPPSQAHYGYLSPGYEGSKNLPSFANSLVPQQESTMLQQGDQLYGNASQQDQYTIQPHFQQQSQEPHYTLQYHRTALQPMSHSIVPCMQGSSANSASVANTHPTNMHSPWIQSELIHSQVNSNVNPTGQSFPTMLSFSMPNIMQSYPQSVTVNAGHPNMGPPHVMGRYMGGIEMQVDAYSNTGNIRQPQQSPQRTMPVSCGSYAHMSQSFPQTQQSMNIAQGIANSTSPASFNSQTNQSQRIANQNMSQNKSSQASQNVQLRYENVTPPVESRGQINYNRSFQISSLKNNKPVTTQSVNTNLLNKSSHNIQQLPNTSSPSNLTKSVSSREVHNTAFSQAFSMNIVNRPEDIRQTQERLSSVPPVPVMSHGQLSENMNQNKRRLSQRSRSATGGVVASRDGGNSIVSLMDRSEKVNSVISSEMSAPQRGSARGILSPGGGRGASTRGTARGLAKKGAAKATEGGLSADVSKYTASSDERINHQYRPVQWYKLPVAVPTDIEAMRAEVNAVSVSQNSNSDGNLQNAQVGIHIYKQNGKPTDSSSSPFVSSHPTSSNSSTSPIRITNPQVNHSESFPNKKTANRGDVGIEVNTMKETASRLTGEHKEVVSSHSIKHTLINARPTSSVTKMGATHTGSLANTSISNKCTSLSSQTQKNSSSVTSASSNNSSVSISPSPSGQDKVIMPQRNCSGNEQARLHETPNLKELITSERTTIAMPQAVNASAIAASASSHSSQKTTFDKGMLPKVKAEPLNGMSARQKVYSLWCAGQVVGRGLAKRKGKSICKEQSSENSSSTKKDNTRVVIDVSQRSNQEAKKPHSKNTRQIPEKINSQQEQAPFHALFHGHKIMCIRSKQGDSVLVCQFLHECFPDKGKGSINNCINRALRIKKKPLECVLKDKIISYLTNNGYLHGRREGELVFTISLNDAKRVYHYIYNIANCSSASCVVQHVNLFVDLDAVIPQSEWKTLRRVKKEKKSVEDRKYGVLTKVDVRKEKELNKGESSKVINNLSQVSGSNATQAALGREEDDGESDDSIIVEGPEDPFFIRSDANEKKIGNISKTLMGSVRSYHHKGENYHSVQDLCEILGYNEFMSIVERDNVDLFSCCSEILSFLNSMKPGFVRLTSGQNSLIREKDVGSYSCNEDEDSGTNDTFFSAKRVNCKQEVVEDEAECSSCKQPRLETVTNDINIPHTTSSSSFPNVSINLGSSSQSSSMDVLDTVYPEVSDLHVEKSQERKQMNTESPDLQDENTNTILIIDASLVSDKSKAALSIHEELESEEISNEITAAILRETFSNTKIAYPDSANKLLTVPGNSSDTDANSSVNINVNAGEDISNIIIQSNSPPNHNERVKNDDNASIMKLQAQQSKTIDICPKSNRAQTGTDIDTNTNVLTVIDNPYRLNPTATILKSGRSSPLSTLHSSHKDLAVALRQNTSNISPPQLETPKSSAGSSLEVLPGRTSVRRHTVPLQNVPTETSKGFAKSLEMPVNSSVSPQIVSVASPHQNEVIILDSVSTTIRAASQSVKTSSNQARKQGTSDCDSIASVSSFLQVASSPSFTVKPKSAASSIEYYADDLVLLSPCQSGKHDIEAYKTQQSLLKGMDLLRYKNKALQDLVKHLRHELRNSKEKNENSTKMIRYYENVLQEITATFKDGEPEGEDLKEIPKQQVQKLDTCGVSTSPILIDDD